MSPDTPIPVGLVGLGNLGSAIGNLIAGNGYSVLGWEYDAAVVNEINGQHINARYLVGITLPPNLAATTDLAAVFARSQIIFVALPSAYIRSTLQPMVPNARSDQILVNMAKGIDGTTGLTAFQTVSYLFPTCRRVMLSGPSIANEFAHGMPTVVVIASPSITDLMPVSRVLDNDTFRTRFSDDALGVELGGVLKNIYAIGLGIFDGEGVESINFRAVYLTIALEEMTRFGVALGAKAETFAYLAGMGDLLATALSEHSHNRRMGEYLSQGLTAEKIKERMGVMPEGYNTLRIVLNIGEKMHVSLPLAEGLWDVIHGRMDAERFIHSFIRDFVDE